MLAFQTIAVFLSSFMTKDMNTDTDEDSYRPPKRSRTGRPPVSQDDTDMEQSSPGRSQPGHSREDVPMTPTDDDHYEDDDEEAEYVNNEMYKIQGTLREWVTRDEVRCFIGKKFEDFLLM